MDDTKESSNPYPSPEQSMAAEKTTKPVANLPTAPTSATENVSSTSRRTFLQRVAGVLGLSALVGAGIGAAAHKAAGEPNTTDVANAVSNTVNAISGVPEAVKETVYPAVGKILEGSTGAAGAASEQAQRDMEHRAREDARATPTLTPEEQASKDFLTQPNKPQGQ